MYKQPNALHKWFLTLYDERKNKQGWCNCFECGKPVKDKYTTVIYSHLLEKGKYKQFAMNPDNVVICCFNCHTLYTMRPKKAIRQYTAAQLFKEKYIK